MAAPRPRLVSSGPGPEAAPADAPHASETAVDHVAEPAAASDPLLEFPAEATIVAPTERPPAATVATRAATTAAAAPAVKAPLPKKPQAPPWPVLSRSVLIVAAAVVVGVTSAFAVVRSGVLSKIGGAFGGGTSRLTIDTRPAGADVLVDGQQLGVTPVTLSLKSGSHTVIVRRAGDERVLPLTLASGADVSQYFEMRVAEAAPAPKGGIAVVTDPPGARVRVDGQPHGVSPLSIADLTPGEHKVSISTDAGVVEKKVMVEAGALASVVFSNPKAAAPFGGWLTVASPFDVQVLERDEVVGASGATRIMLPAGRHDVVLANRTLGYQETRKIDVAAGKTTSVKIEAPKAPLSVNARPWADVSVDGAGVGQTPIANLTVAIGVHQVVFRHPQYGERRQSVTVTSKGPNRLAVDFTKPE